ncbi:pyruvate formate-lyase-activating protein [Microbacterium lacticum]|uniref:Pyruvate formate-lyase-activating enzyme n=1 Tax=Microbacterium lacticum TaxID=33885 RepID=A0A4Y3URH7_9MICO|nr:pyruvate formate-lyase-activating protein [Microbacterium lacticum]TQM95116.1 pyruvate formate lyase activating enzyme [Microbacterium lacticum]GEB95495.1 pyruvate formate-lyase-activating enzyme [Microbacterium lacticum]GGI67070.1 pyruvate formate-lyase-activating enzyme [Microbacterium lacticum]
MVATLIHSTIEAPLGGLEVADVSRHERLTAMREGRLGSVHSWELVTAVDGPGTRLTTFLSGCPLQCLYCHNPDTLAMKDGHPVTSDELLARIARYRGVFRATGGGITLSGGEVLMQPAFAARILRGAKDLGIHTAIDTSGFLGAAATDAMLEDVDLVLLDVKSGDPDTYRRVTGRDLEPTLAFGRRLAEMPHGPEVWIRFVLVPGLTDDIDNVERVAEYAASLNEIMPGTVTRVEVLPFHQMGRDKWAALGRDYQLGDTQPPTPALTERVRDQFRAHGLTTY